MNNNPPIAAIDIPEGSFWYNKTEDKIRLFSVVRKWYNSDDTLTFELSELNEIGVKKIEVLAKDFLDNANNGKMIYLNTLTPILQK